MTAAVVLLALVIVIGLVAGGTVISFNRFVRQRNLVDEAWRQADVELRRRHDLIPNLVETVKGYAAHERAVLQGVTEARGSAVDASRSDDASAQGAAELALSRALGRLIAVAEQYPDLKANATFRQLMTELVDTEDRIAATRRFYNGNVRALNTRVEGLPSGLVARTFGVQKAEYFEVDDVVTSGSVNVDFASLASMDEIDVIPLI